MPRPANSNTAQPLPPFSLPSDAVSSKEVRRLLSTLIKSPSDFDAFCLDYFPDVHYGFSTGMDKVAKINRLLENCRGELMPIVTALREEFPLYFLRTMDAGQWSEKRSDVAYHDYPVAPYNQAVETTDLSYHSQTKTETEKPENGCSIPSQQLRCLSSIQSHRYRRLFQIVVFFICMGTSVFYWPGLSLLLGSFSLWRGWESSALHFYELACSPQAMEACLEAGQIYDRRAYGMRRNQKLQATREEYRSRALHWYSLACQSKQDTEDVREGCFAAGLISQAIVDGRHLAPEVRERELRSAIWYLQRACQLGLLRACENIHE